MKIQENRKKWIESLYKLRLQNLTATFLEALGPMNLLGAQLVYLSHPVVPRIGMTVYHRRYQKYRLSGRGYRVGGDPR